MTSFDQFVPAPNGRFDGITRPYTADDVQRLRGSFVPDHSLARRGALKLWERMKNDPAPVRALGAVRVLSAETLSDDDITAKNTLDLPERVGLRQNPSAVASGEEVTVTLPPVSWTALSLG